VLQRQRGRPRERERNRHREGGVARFSITFVDAGDNVFPGARDDTVQEVDDAADECEDAAEDDFADALDLSGPGSVLADALSAAGTLDDVLDMVNQVTSLGGLSGPARGVVGLRPTSPICSERRWTSRKACADLRPLVQGVAGRAPRCSSCRPIFDDHATRFR
jgi:hypothetical protein